MFPPDFSLCQFDRINSPEFEGIETKKKKKAYKNGKTCMSGIESS